MSLLNHVVWLLFSWAVRTFNFPMGQNTYKHANNRKRLQKNLKRPQRHCFPLSSRLTMYGPIFESLSTCFLRDYTSYKLFRNLHIFTTSLKQHAQEQFSEEHKGQHANQNLGIVISCGKLLIKANIWKHSIGKIWQLEKSRTTLNKKWVIQKCQFYHKVEI